MSVSTLHDNLVTVLA